MVVFEKFSGSLRWKLVILKKKKNSAIWYHIAFVLLLIYCVCHMQINTLLLHVCLHCIYHSADNLLACGLKSVTPVITSVISQQFNLNYKLLINTLHFLAVYSYFWGHETYANRKKNQVPGITYSRQQSSSCFKVNKTAISSETLTETLSLRCSQGG